MATEQIHAHLITEEVMQQFRQKQAILETRKKCQIDNLAGHIALVFELEFPQSYEIVKEQGYLDRLLAVPKSKRGTYAAISGNETDHAGTFTGDGGKKSADCVILAFAGAS